MTRSFGRRSTAGSPTTCTGIGDSRATKSRTRSSPPGTRTVFTAGRLDRGVEQAEPARQVLLDRQLRLELRLQLELRRVVAVLAVVERDERPPRAALEAVDPVDGVRAALEPERGGKELRAEALLGQPLRDRVHGGDEVLEVRVAHDHPLEAV